MRFAELISKNMEQILAEWEARAAVLFFADEEQRPLALREYAQSLLLAIGKDIAEAPQNTLSTATVAGEATSLATCAALRHLAGFRLQQLGLEYRALRAAVVSHWRTQCPQMPDAALADMTLFHELLDQSLAEYIARYSDEVARTRDAFLTILGHDLRSPLSAITMAGDYLSMPGMLEGKQLQAATGIKNSAANMSSMIKNLLAYTRARLGRRMPLTPVHSHVGIICEAVLDEVRRAHPEYSFHAELSGDLHGEVDPGRMQQMLTNIFYSAVQQGPNGQPVTLVARGESDKMMFELECRGDLVPVDVLQMIVNPLVQVPFDAADEDASLSSSVGLGIFTAREIALAHGGSITVSEPDRGGTLFTVCLPRRQLRQPHMKSDQQRLRYG